MFTHLRIARPVTDLERSVAMYVHGLELRILGHFANHEGFDGVMLGHPGFTFHFEFTHCRDRPVIPSPTPEDLLIVYLPDRGDWTETCSRLLAAGFVAIEPFNPYWNQRGRTVADPDGYQVVVEHDSWPGGARQSSLQTTSP